MACLEVSPQNFGGSIRTATSFEHIQPVAAQQWCCVLHVCVLGSTRKVLCDGNAVVQLMVGESQWHAFCCRSHIQPVYAVGSVGSNTVLVIRLTK